MKTHFLRTAWFLLGTVLILGSLRGYCSEACTPKFPLRAPWLGADAAYSIPLPDGRSIWIFGDTLYGDKRVVNGENPRMVRNSIGISQCDGDKWDLKYVIKKGKTGELTDFFKANKKGTWYWALDGFYYDQALWVSLLCIRSVPVTTSNAFGFETCGSDLAKVTGLEKDPQQWKVEIQPLVSDGTKAYPSATTFTDNNYAYFFALYESGSRPMMVVRAPLKSLSAAGKNLEYLSRDGKWKHGFDPKDAKEVMKTGNTEMTVRYHPELKKWVAVMNYPMIFTDKIIVRTADSFTGPWTEGTDIYAIPELQKNSAGYDPDTFCYAGKEHPEYRTKDSILITYACNTTKVQKLTSELGIYFPQVVRIPLNRVTENTEVSQ